MPFFFIVNFILPVMILLLLLHSFHVIYFLFFAVVIICCWQRTVNICATRYEHLFWLQVTINMAIFRTPWSPAGKRVPANVEIEIWILSAHILCFLFACYLPSPGRHVHILYIVRMCIWNLASLPKVHELKILHISFALYARIFRRSRGSSFIPMQKSLNECINERLSAQQTVVEAGCPFKNRTRF